MFARLALLLALSSCQCGPGRCDVSNCVGCCDARLGCLPGENSTACGANAVACFTCSRGLVCHRGECRQPGIGIGAGGGTAGGLVSTAGGSTAGGSTAGGAVFFPGINDVVGRPCTTSASCLPLGATPLLCSGVVLPGGTREVCGFACDSPGSACGGPGVCTATVSVNASCLDCVFTCTGALGTRGSCAPNELCVNGVCSPDCRLRGARCPLGETCQGDGVCSALSRVSYCRALLP